MAERETLVVDFNDIDANRHVPALLVLANAHVNPSPGDVVRLHDDEGNSCDGRVVSVSNGVAVIEPEWASWRKAGSVKITNQYAPRSDDLTKMLMETLKAGYATSNPELVVK